MWLKIPVDLDTEASNIHLLRELDRWIALGLLSKGQAINLGRQLCSPLPIADSAPLPPQDNPSEVAAVAAETVFEISVDRLFFSRFKSRLVQSFLTEMSVLWLLFLGVFLVVVSSGVLAASQWQSFSAVGQYAILLVYTLVFGGASRWAAGQAKLQTTAQMLKAATLLLIPLNMWMMDTLGLFNASVGLAMLASVGLSLLTLMLAPQRRTGFNLLGLSWLHWGWGLASWPLVASYLGTLGSATNLLQRVSGDATDVTKENQSGPGGILVAIALLILLVRSVWVAQVPIYQLGLACGICGWMLHRLRYQAGLGLMLLGWLVSGAQQPLQAIGISGLAGWLLLERLQRQERDQLRTLSALWLVGLQTCGLAWLALPIDLRQTLLTAAQKFSVEPVSALNLTGVWLYGYVGLMALGVRQFQHQGNDAWAQQTERLALGLSGALLLCALPQAESFLFTLSLLGLTLTFGAFTQLRRPATSWLIYGTHSAAVVTLLSGLYVISMRVPGWGDPQWAGVFIGLTAVEWIASVATGRYPEWRRSAWYLGIGLSVMAYSLLLNNWGSWLNLGWLVVPGLLTWLVHRRQFATEQPQLATTLTVLALGGQILLLSSWQMATAVCAVGTGLLLLHSRRWPTQKYLPALTVGFALGGGHAAASWLWLMASPWPHNLARLFLVIALFASGLSILARTLDQQSRPLLQTYGTASYGWSRGLAVILSLGLTLMMILVHGLGPGDRIVMIRPILPGIAILLRYGIAAITLVLARFWGQRQLTNADYWELAHGVALWVTMGISLWHQETNPQTLGAAMVAMGLIAQLMGTVKAHKHNAYKTSWHYIPLVYGGLGLLLGHLNFTATTGFYSAVVGIVTLAIGQRQPALRPLGYSGLGLLSLGIYELVLYHLLQASGGAPGDGLTILALVGAAIAALYLLCHTWIQRYSQLTEAEIMITSLLHWLLAVALAAMAMVMGQSLVGIWLGVAGLLSLYAWLKGNYRWFPTHQLDSAGEYVPSEHHSYKQWTWSGLVIATVAIPYGAGQLLPNLTFVKSWGGLLACGLSLLIYRLPWRPWGWPWRPWQRMALGWPILATLLGIAVVKTQSLLLVGAFYAAMAKQLRAVRLSYLSLGLLNWSLLRYLLDRSWLTPLWFGTLLGLSALYILEVDPHWQEHSTRQERHRLRSFATLLVGLTAIFQAETASLIFIGLSLLISFGFMGLGLVQQVRAYLYTGTLTFALQILRTLMMFVDTDGRLLWAVGIVLGIALIWVAATFESRRAQVSGLLSQWSERLSRWD